MTNAAKVSDIQKGQSGDPDEPRVTLGGQELDTKKYKHDGDVVWGSLLIVGGALLLLNALRIVSWDVWQHLWQFWPVLLILGGLHLVLGNSAPARLLLLIVSIGSLGLIALFGLEELGSPLFDRVPIEIRNAVNYLRMIRSL